MWVKKTPQEIAKARKAKNRESAVLVCGLSFVFILLLAMFPHIKQGKANLLPWSEVVRNFSRWIIPGFIAGGIVELLRRRGSIPEVICTKCGTAKYRDEMSDCACGGKFELLEEMKWTDDNE